MSIYIYMHLVCFISVYIGGGGGREEEGEGEEGEEGRGEEGRGFRGFDEW